MFETSTMSCDNSSSLIDVEMSTSPRFVLTVKYYMSLVRICTLLPFGIMGSVMTLLVVCHTKPGSTSFSSCIMIVAIADGLWLSFTIIGVSPVVGMWPKPVWYCKMSLFMNSVTSVQSDHTVTVMSVHRAVAVTVPHKVKLIFTPKRTLLYMLFVGVFNVLINIHIMLTIDSNGVGGCATVLKYIGISQIFNAMIMLIFVSIFVTNSVCSTLIIFRLRQRHIQMAGVRSGQANNETQITIILLSIVMLYLISTLPLMVSYFYTLFILKRGQGTFNGKTDIMIILHQAAILMKDLSDVCNFYAYCLSSKLFRKVLIDLIWSYIPTCWKCRCPA